MWGVFLSCIAPYVLNSWSLCIPGGVCNDIHSIGYLYTASTGFLPIHKPCKFSPSCILLFKHIPLPTFTCPGMFYTELMPVKPSRTHQLNRLHFPQSQHLKRYLSEQTGPCCFHGPLCCLVNARLFPWEIKEWLWAFSAPQNCVTL